MYEERNIVWKGNDVSVFTIQVLSKRLLGVVLGGILLLTCCGCAAAIFLSTSSPDRIYTVNLTGRKERPRFFTNEVRLNVLKNGKPYMSDLYLHSGDAFDISFEFGYPDYRWLNLNVLQFYKEENFKTGKPDTLVVTNKTDKNIKYLVVFSRDDVLILDMPSHSETDLRTSPSRDQSKGFTVKGEFTGGGTFKNGGSFKVPNGVTGPFTYYINITEGKVDIESLELEKN